MGVNKTADDVETLGVPVASAPPVFTGATRAIGRPWSTGLYDCHENQTNAEMGRIEASELNGGQLMAQPVAMPTVIQQPGLTSIQGGLYQDQATGGMVENFVNGRPWTTGLFDCHEHKTNAVMTAFFPCVTFGQIAEVMDEGEMSKPSSPYLLPLNALFPIVLVVMIILPWFSAEGREACPLGSFIYLLMMPALCSQWVMGSKYRAKLRRKYDLVEAPHQDIVSHIFCPCCSLCQEFRELKIRGLDPALGWNGILAQQQGRQNQDQELKVPPNQAMFK